MAEQLFPTEVDDLTQRPQISIQLGSNCCGLIFVSFIEQLCAYREIWKQYTHWMPKWATGCRDISCIGIDICIGSGMRLDAKINMTMYELDKHQFSYWLIATWEYRQFTDTELQLL